MYVSLNGLSRFSGWSCSHLILIIRKATGKGKANHVTVKEIYIPTGTPLLLGAPVKPMDSKLSSQIGELADSIEGFMEAHLPQTFAVGVMEEPVQVLVVVLELDADIKAITRQLGVGLGKILPEGMHLDVWPIPKDHPMLNDIRGANCKL